MSIQYDMWQIAYVLGMKASGVQGQSGTSDSLANQLSTDLKDFYDSASDKIGQWSTVWGPAVFQNVGDQYADNTIYVAANSDASTYVVCIAGTNGSSNYDIKSEDEDVYNVVDWGVAFTEYLGQQSTPSNLTPFISQGTKNGVTAVLSLIDNLITGLTLKDYLFKIKNTSSTLIFSGHSLGGAIAPTLALAYFNSEKPNSGPLSISDWANVFIYPTAGPTPGNGDFSNFYSLIFPVVKQNDWVLPYQVWNANVWNSLDVVPHAWNISMMHEIPFIYHGLTKYIPSSYINTMIQPLIGYSETGGLKMKRSSYQMLPNCKILGKPGFPMVPNTKIFELEALYQHIQEYSNLLNVNELIDDFDISMNLAFIRRILRSG